MKTVSLRKDRFTKSKRKNLRTQVLKIVGLLAMLVAFSISASANGGFEICTVPCASLDTASSFNQVQIHQHGRRNIASFSQRGSGNLSFVYQDGSSNEIIQKQIGSHSVVAAVQKGDGNVIVQEVAGRRNRVYATQWGDGNKVHQLAIQSRYPLCARQIGDNNRIIQVGYGCTVTQYGNGMVARVYRFSH